MQQKPVKRPIAAAVAALHDAQPVEQVAPSTRRSVALPLGALVLAASTFSQPAVAQDAAPQDKPVAAEEQVMPTVEVQATRESGKDTLRATTTSIGKGNQDIKDIPQSVTVLTERLMDDRNLDDFREVLRNTAGVTFQAGETGEEDVRLRGFSLGQAGDIYRDGMRDGTLYERDTFNDERVEVLKGSASMLFGKGSTGGIVNQVSKQPFLIDQHEVSYTIGTGQEHRLTGDFNIVTGEDAALRINAMVHDAENWGAEQKKTGIAPTFTWGIGTRDEFSVGLFHLESEGRPLYNHPWLTSNADNSGDLIETLPAKNYYGLASDHLDTSATYATVSHIRRFADGGELKTQVRHGRYERDLLASVIRFCNGSPTSSASQRAACPGQVISSVDQINGSTVLSRSPKGRIGESDTTQVSSDYSGTFEWGGRQHDVLAGVDFYHEDAKRNNSFTGPLGGSSLSFPYTTVGTPNDGASVADTRGAPPFDNFDARNIGIYAQDTMGLTDTLKLVGGLRFDHFRASYRTFARPESTGRGGVVIPAVPALSGEMSDNLWSPRIGLLYQPNDLSSYYASFGTSYNTSADTYQFALGTGDTEKLANTPPEKSRNFEIGGKWEMFERRALVGVAAFYSEKYNERNTDADSVAEQFLLAGKRHAAGMEFNLAGRITSKWEAFFNHTWIPEAEIDKSDDAEIVGDRPGLTPRHSGSLWTTYRVLPQLRLGAGLTYRGKQTPSGNDRVTADSFVVADAMAEYTFSETWSARLNVTNLTDELYADSLYRGFYAPGAPRRVQLTLKANF